MDNKKIGHELRKLRIEKGLNQSQLGAHLNVSRSAIGNWERGDRTISIEDLTLIAQYFAVPISFFTGEVVQENYIHESDSYSIIKVYQIKPKPNIVQLLITLYLVLVSVTGIFFSFGERDVSTVVFYVFWLTVLLLLIAHQLYSLNKHMNNLSFSCKKLPFFSLKDKGKIRVDYFGHIFLSILILVSMFMYFVVFKTYYRDDSLAQFVITCSLIFFIFSGFTNFVIFTRPPKRKFRYYPTNRYFSLAYFDILFYSSVLFSIIMSGILILKGVDNIPLVISLITIFVMLAMVMVSYILRLERRILFTRYQIVIE